MEYLPIFDRLLQFDIPLALGWPLAIWLFISNQRTHKTMTERLFNIVEGNTEAMTKLADNIKFLIDTRKDR